MVNHKVENQVQRVMGQRAAELHNYFKKYLAIICGAWWILMVLLEFPNRSGIQDTNTVFLSYYDFSYF